MWSKMKPGSEIRLHDGLAGTIVINFETQQTSDGYELGGWSDHEGGLLVLTSDLGLVRYPRDVLNEKYRN